MGLVRPHDSHRGNAVPGSELCPVFPLRGDAGAFILFRHLLPSITSDLAVLASLDVGWAIINISTLSFLGLGVQAPTPEWGAMLNEAKEVLTSNPTQMIAPGVAIVVLVCCFNLMGDALRDVLDPKEVEG